MGRWVKGWDGEHWIDVWIDEKPRLYRGTAEVKTQKRAFVLDVRGRPIRTAKPIGFRKEEQTDA